MMIDGVYRALRHTTYTANRQGFIEKNGAGEPLWLAGANLFNKSSKKLNPRLFRRPRPRVCRYHRAPPPLH